MLGRLACEHFSLGVRPSPLANMAIVLAEEAASAMVRPSELCDEPSTVGVLVGVFFQYCSSCEHAKDTCKLPKIIDNGISAESLEGLCLAW